jgi:cobyric acid synthase
VKSKAISLKFVSESGEPVGYLMVETDDEKFAKQTARQWGERKLDTPFTGVELHQGVMHSPDFDSDVFNGVRVWELPF